MAEDAVNDEMNSQKQEAAKDAGPEAADDPGTVGDAGPETASGPETGGDDGQIAEVREQTADRTASGDAPVSGEAEVADEVRELRIERDRFKEQHLRLAADFDNYRKRADDRLRQRWDRAQADLVSRLLDPFDDLLRVTALEPENTSSVEAIVEGVDLVERKFFRVLEDAGVEIVDPEGEKFDPNTMEAVMRVAAESEEDDEMVERVFQRGYTLRGLLVRPARVSVFKA